jgi:pilus assembly protein CpaB
MTYRTRNIAIAVGLALVAMLLTLLYVVNYRKSVDNGQATSHVYVATRDIPAGTPGTELAHGSLRLIDVPRRTVAPGAISNPSQVVGLILSQPLYPGDQVTLHRFATLRAQGISGQLRGTMRAVQVPGDVNQLLAGTLQAGDRVDVVANLHDDPSEQAPTTKIVLRNLDVLQTAPSSLSATVQSGGGTYVILAVDDTQVERLFYVLKNADWTLDLRPAAGAKNGPSRVETPTSVLHEAA